MVKKKTDQIEWFEVWPRSSKVRGENGIGKRERNIYSLLKNVEISHQNSSASLQKVKWEPLRMFTFCHSIKILKMQNDM